METSKCLAILNLLITLPTLSPIWSAPTRRPSRTAEMMGARASSVAANSSLRLRVRSSAKQRVATGDEPFVGVVGMGELGQVALVEEAELQRSVVFDQGGDLGRPQAGQPPEVAHFA